MKSQMVINPVDQKIKGVRITRVELIMGLII